MTTLYWPICTSILASSAKAEWIENDLNWFYSHAWSSASFLLYLLWEYCWHCWLLCRICITYEHNNGLAHYRVLYSLAFEHWNMEAKGQGFDSSCGLFVPCSWWDDKHLSTRNAPFGLFWYHSYGRSSPSSNGFSKKLGNVWLHAMQGRFWCGNELNFFFWNDIISFRFVP